MSTPLLYYSIAVTVALVVALILLKVSRSDVRFLSHQWEKLIRHASDLADRIHKVKNAEIEALEKRLEAMRNSCRRIKHERRQKPRRLP